MLPVRGAWLLVDNDGRRFPRIDAAHCSSLADASTGGAFLFIVPRGRDKLILGGIAQPGHWATDLGAEHAAITRAIVDKCAALLPDLGRAEVLASTEVRVGLRPFRRAGVRVERDRQTPVVHNCGHGGSGVTLSWGSALDAARLAESMVAGQHRARARVPA